MTAPRYDMRGFIVRQEAHPTRPFVGNYVIEHRDMGVFAIVPNNAQTFSETDSKRVRAEDFRAHERADYILATLKAAQAKEPTS